jgi:2-polyprenyl-3-methyl-5-hydroxy-6-metoxy-1,4-benzoquinol methylase
MELYEAVRTRENRIHSDDVVRALPSSGSRTPHAAEWRIRARSLRRLTTVLRSQGAGLRILDVGCGNGWMSAALAKAGHSVVALDMHRSELEQAARLFTGLDVTWCQGDPRSVPLPADRFDAIILAASLQYFEDLPTLFSRLMPSLRQAGTIHVLDTILYPDQGSAAAAQQRSQLHYTAMGVPEMAAHYHAHRLADLERTGPAMILMAPSGRRLMPRLLGRANPFHHVVIHRGMRS